MVEQSLKRRLPIPEAIMNKPELDQALNLFWRCYFDLRKGYDKYAPLRWLDVQKWCETYGLAGASAREVHAAVSLMDIWWLELNPRPKQEGGNNGNLGRNRRG